MIKGHGCVKKQPMPKDNLDFSTSIHFCCSSGFGGSSLSRETQTSLTSLTASSSSGGTTRRSQASQETASLSPASPSLPQGLLPVGRSQNTSPRRCPRGILVRPPHLAIFDVEEKQLCYEALSNNRAPHPISKGEPNYSLEEAHLCRLYPKPELTTIGEG